MNKEINKNKTNKFVFDVLADVYEDTFGFIDYTSDIIELLFKGKVLKTKILDLGCGIGTSTENILKLNQNIEVTGIDVSEKMIELARKKNPKASFIQMNMEQLNFAEGSFDYVISFSAILLLSESSLLNTLHEVSKVLKVGGKFVFTLVEGHKKNQEIPIIFKTAEDPVKPFIIQNMSLHVNTYKDDEIKKIMTSFRFKFLWMKRYNYQVFYDSHRDENHLCFCYERIV